MKAIVGTFNQEKALVGAFSVIVQPVVEPMDRFTALAAGHQAGHRGAERPAGGHQARWRPPARRQAGRVRVHVRSQVSTIPQQQLESKGVVDFACVLALT